MKGARVGVIVALVMIAVLMGCGGGASTTISGFSSRALITNAFAGNLAPQGFVEIADTVTSSVSGTTITVGAEPGLMAVSPGLETTLVFDMSANQVSAINNAAETLTTTIQLPDFTESLVAQNANTGFAAVPNAAVSGQAILGVVVALNVPGSAISATIPVPHARRIVMNHSATKLLVFSDNYTQPCSAGSSALSIIDLTNLAAPPSIVCGFDQAVWGVFSSDDSTAYIMNCGPECGGQSAGVAILNMAVQSVASTLTFPATGALAAGATVGILNGANLYVAGTINGALGAGTLTLVNVGSGTPVASAPIHISDGTHTRMALADDNKLFVGSVNCTNNPTSSTPTGCLTIFDTSANTAVIDSAKGSVTGLAPIMNRHVVYVAEGGAMHIYDTRTNAESATMAINITGDVVDVKTIDQPQQNSVP